MAEGNLGITGVARNQQEPVRDNQINTNSKKMQERPDSNEQNGYHATERNNEGQTTSNQQGQQKRPYRGTRAGRARQEYYRRRHFNDFSRFLAKMMHDSKQEEFMGQQERYEDQESPHQRSTVVARGTRADYAEQQHHRSRNNTVAEFGEFLGSMMAAWEQSRYIGQHRNQRRNMQSTHMRNQQSTQKANDDQEILQNK